MLGTYQEKIGPRHIPTALKTDTGWLSERSPELWSKHLIWKIA